ncbi:hypothetical protein B0T21DRAFT_19059 [Apiosordaria backusii]|uniref:Secreted protein n=1 Tax=Apiosordaria backusii TaxID=314023 RepID=A0AA40EZ58_9PEZI|nr:hypothetical protein B0T21DRAFT_19059 [Apiosordaria backusii]
MPLYVNGFGLIFVLLYLLSLTDPRCVPVNWHMLPFVLTAPIKIRPLNIHSCVRLLFYFFLSNVTQRRVLLLPCQWLWWVQALSQSNDPTGVPARYTANLCGKRKISRVPCVT